MWQPPLPDSPEHYSDIMDLAYTVDKIDTNMVTSFIFRVTIFEILKVPVGCPAGALDHQSGHPGYPNLNLKVSKMMSLGYKK